MPQIAPAALARMRRESGFSPAMSTTEYIIVMSFTSTYGAVLPDAIVETITLGTPTGSVAHRRGDHRRAAAAAEAEHAVEAAARRRARAPARCAPRSMTSTAVPRSPRARSAASVAPPARATSSARMSTANGAALAEHAEVHREHVDAARQDQVADEGVLRALRVEACR